jgi:hypothetical protein
MGGWLAGGGQLSPLVTTVAADRVKPGGVLAAVFCLFFACTPAFPSVRRLVFHYQQALLLQQLLLPVLPRVWD